ncbi:carbohydrate ABC transporter permease [Aquihabitans sp. G128]|uniref:carbohydrate ABC transporter permease n=1 Tax=Aquihabitans sp. G128 TaxID=2849779 RepID=UPI001C212124|nr:carbohydrate ABC transporter permease [Aquihabitans sp. G128]QXC62893.1 carbohydrate ABC transporter permease [Aquihabitans sp. G128]
MATNDLTPVGADTEASRGVRVATGHSSRRQLLSKVWQYAMLVALAAIVIGPLLLTLRQALTPPFQWVNKGRPPYPVEIAWKDRTWFTGGPVSLVGRTLVVLFLFAWLQKVAADLPWTRWRQLLTPARLVAILGGTVVLAVATGPAFASLHDADGRSQWLVLAAMVAVFATQLWGYLDGGRRKVGYALVQSAFTAFGLVGTAVIFVGPEVWTTSWGRYDLGSAMFRSLIMAVLITVLQVTTSIMSAYAFVFLRFPFKRILFALFMATLLLPLEVTLVGNIATIRQLEWTNTMQALVLPFGATALGTFLIRQGFRGLPSEIQDATRLDGYGHVSFLTKFAVPLTRPVIASFTVISALQAWNQYLWPRAVISENSFNTLQIQLRFVSAGEVANANQAIAAALVASVPVIVLLIAFQRQIIRGLTAGAVK